MKKSFYNKFPKKTLHNLFIKKYVNLEVEKITKMY